MWTEDRERKWEVDDIIVPMQREMGFTMLGGLGGFHKTKAQKWIYRGRVFRVNIVLLLFKTERQNKEGGMHSGWWVCIGSGDSVQLQLLRAENNR